MFLIIYFHPNHLGSSSYITNQTGRVSQHMEYMPFGETLVDEHINSFNSPFKFNGKEYDEETGNYYYSARYYDPKFSIFIGVDPMADKYPGISPFAYCLNNPLRFVDPTGMEAVDPNPIYDPQGNFLGTDDRGLQGKGIVMSEENFRQGMSHDEAEACSIGPECFNSPEAYEKTSKHHASLSSRPDYDGVVTLGEAMDWYTSGKGQPLYVDVTKMDFKSSSVSVEDFKSDSFQQINFFNKYNSQSGDPSILYRPARWGTISDGFTSNPLSDVYGTLRINLLDAKTG